MLPQGYSDNPTRDCPVVVSIDECNFSERVMPLYGYSKRGTRCVLRNNKGGWVKQSLLLAMCSDGHMHHRVIKGSVDRDLFKEFILDLPLPHDSVVLMDNATIHHKTQDVFEAKMLHAAYLPPYSPQFNPVENAFSKIKTHFRSQWPWHGGVADAVASSVDSVCVQDVVGYFRNWMHLIGA